MYLCYVDESGVPEIPGNSTHFVLAGIAIPIERWREADAAISVIMNKYGLAGAELHAAWLLRKYLEQSKIDGFESMDWDQRRAQVERSRVAEVHRVRKLGIAKRNAQLKKVYKHTSPYIHLTLQERLQLAAEIAATVAGWEWARLFASCIDKSYFLTQSRADQVNQSAFTRILFLFAQFLQDVEGFKSIEKESEIVSTEYGLIIHDNNPTVAEKHTQLMRNIRVSEKTRITEFLDRIIETPLFVDSSLTRMVQVADLWGYALRRYVENGEQELFSVLNATFQSDGSKFKRVLFRKSLHHLSEPSCACAICKPEGGGKP